MGVARQVSGVGGVGETPKPSSEFASRPIVSRLAWSRIPGGLEARGCTGGMGRGGGSWTGRMGKGKGRGGGAGIDWRDITGALSEGTRGAAGRAGAGVILNVFFAGTLILDRSRPPPAVGATDTATAAAADADATASFLGIFLAAGAGGSAFLATFFGSVGGFAGFVFSAGALGLAFFLGAVAGFTGRR